MRELREIEEFVILDIETLPTPLTDSSEGALRAQVARDVPANYKNPETIQKWIDENFYEKWRKTALDASRGRILLVCAEDSNGRQFSFFFDQEDYRQSVLNFETNFLEWTQGKKILLIGHNLENFDLLYLKRHAAMFGANRLLAELLRTPTFDTMLEWNFACHKEKYVSLTDLAGFLGVDGKDPFGITGSQIYDYYSVGRLSEILDYCKRDVRICHTIFATIYPIFEWWCERRGFFVQQKPGELGVF